MVLSEQTFGGIEDRFVLRNNYFDIELTNSSPHFLYAYLEHCPILSNKRSNESSCSQKYATISAIKCVPLVDREVNTRDIPQIGVSILALADNAFPSLRQLVGVYCRTFNSKEIYPPPYLPIAWQDTPGRDISVFLGARAFVWALVRPNRTNVRGDIDMDSGGCCWSISFQACFPK